MFWRFHLDCMHLKSSWSHISWTSPKTHGNVTKLNIPQKKMFEFLREILPDDVIILIAVFEGRIVRSYLKQHISQIYSCVFQQYFGRHHNLKFICGPPGLQHDRMRALPFYCAWTTIIKAKYPTLVKIRKSRKHMRPYNGLRPKIPYKTLEKIRKKLERGVTMNLTSRLRQMSS